MTTEMNEPMERGICLTCGQVFFYESMIVGKFDLGKLLNDDCLACTAGKKERQLQEAKNDLRERREEMVRATIPPDLLDTDIAHEGFNYGLWSVVSIWGPSRDFWLGLVGDASKSKTRCMALLAARLIRQGVRCEWTTANRLRDAASDRNHRLYDVAGPARAHLADCKHAAWLFLDDLGKNDWSPAFESQFFQILDHRKNYRLPLVFSSNAHPSAFSQLISSVNASPIIGRLLDRTTIIDLF